MQLMFDCCKWDIQSEDHSVVADYPLFVEEDEWDSVTGLAEKLSQEVHSRQSKSYCPGPIYTKNSVCP